MSRHHCASPALSDTTYYSFNDIELVEPPEPVDCYAQQRLQHKRDFDPFEASKMQRQDSGYESYEPSSPRRTSMSNASSRPPSGSTVTRRNSSSAASANPPRLRSSRPSTRRSYNTYTGGNHHHHHHHLHQQAPPYAVRSYSQSQPPGFVQFPTLDLIELAEPPAAAADDDAALMAPELPQTTHYWTSDSTRRLEYAAIDAAGRGVKGWVRKHLVPDCLVSDQKHLAFDDDTGSVRRYRLHLEEDHGEKHRQDDQAARRSRSWRFWRE
ncbi:hypothetical protein CCM_05299 [Cordyceps militaris CM01]|uniref:Uncharacterized protein n=1 Tax=Cordyceps militaris (strain CM01) TaxID=983644 RepID=G3JIU2_CORMM|nr:uncharacterized protein CCM_05299 [Cordyceps militaris CM01]EGX91141.1 hypothetical protein CCM_05299 [Cordyceps militaris CM01]